MKRIVFIITLCSLSSLSVYGQCDDVTPPKENPNATLPQSIDFIRNNSNCLEIESPKKTEVSRTSADSKKKNSDSPGTVRGRTDSPALHTSPPGERDWVLSNSNGCTISLSSAGRSELIKAQSLTISLSDINPHSIKSSRFTRPSSIIGLRPEAKGVSTPMDWLINFNNTSRKRSIKWLVESEETVFKSKMFGKQKKVQTINTSYEASDFSVLVNSVNLGAN